MESNIIPRSNGKVVKSCTCEYAETKFYTNERFKNVDCSNDYTAIYESSKPSSGRSAGINKSSTSQPLTTNLKSTQEKKQLMEVQGSHRTLFYRQPSRKHVSSYSTVVVDLEGSSKKVSFEPERKPKKEKPSMVITLPLKAQKLATKGTQTDFRESEAQTRPWKHEIQAGPRLLSELFSLDSFTLETNFPLGKEDVMLIEKARQKLAWERILERLRGKENESKRKWLVLRMSANETIFKERRKKEEAMERLKLSRQEMKETRKALEEKLNFRLQRSYTCRRTENRAKINHWNHELARKLRKVKSGRGEKEGKNDIIALHKDKSSALYAPKLRDGENPSLWHEVIDIQCRFLKRFHGLEVLEKHMSDIWRPKFSTSLNIPLCSKSGKLELSLRKFLEKGVEEKKEKRGKGLLLKVAVPENTTKSPPSVSSGSEEGKSESEELSPSVFLSFV